MRRLIVGRHRWVGRGEGVGNVDVRDCTGTSGWPRETSHLVCIDAPVT
jgi:hypothetical protein